MAVAAVVVVVPNDYRITRARVCGGGGTAAMDILKTMQKEMDVDDVQDTMDDLQDITDDMEEINVALTGGADPNM